MFQSCTERTSVEAKLQVLRYLTMHMNNNRNYICTKETGGEETLK